MRILLDTHTLLWYTLNDARLSNPAEMLIRDGGNEVLVSLATYWEIAIKASLGKLKLHRSYDEFVTVCTSQYRFSMLPISTLHTAQVAILPFPPNHRDPFDRLLVSQAMVEQIPIVTCDPGFAAYPIPRLW